MATSPSPNSSPPADPPVSTTAPPPQPSSPPPVPPTSSQPNASSSTATPIPTPPSQSPPSTNSTAPPPVQLLPPPPQPPTSSSPPPPVPPSSSQPNGSSPTATPIPTPPSQSPPSTNSTAPPPVPLLPPPPQPPISSSPPPSADVPRPSAHVPPPSSNSPPPKPENLPRPPSSSAPPLIPNPPSTSPPIPPSDPPASSPTPPSPNLPVSAPTPTPTPRTPPSPPASPPTPTPPSPTPPSEPPNNLPPPPPKPPESTPSPRVSPPPPESTPPQNAPPPPRAEPPKISLPPPPTPIVTPPPPASPPSSNSPPKLSPPPPGKRLSPPPPTLVPPSSPSPPSPSQIPIPPSGNPSTNSSNTPSNSKSTDSGGSGGIGTAAEVSIALVFSLILLLGLIGVMYCVRKKKRKRKFAGLNAGHVLPNSQNSSPISDSALLKVQTSGARNGSGTGNNFVYSPTEPGGLGNSRSWFTYEELVDATNRFSVQHLLGEGGFGSVYKGYLSDGREVAVKQLKIGGGQGEREFKAEVEIISRVHHRHLVSLVGYCISENQRLLVYDYVPNNNLYFHLHGEGRPVMEWETRVRVAVGAARGITYLHEDCHPRIIHRDIKSSNILLDNSYEARVSDFGLAKLALDANTHITTRVMGTFGYMAPEYAATGKLTEKSDVYSFGVVLLELITGRKPVDTSQPLGDESLVEWARPLLSHALDTEDFKVLADPRLENNYVESEMFRLIEAAAACVRHLAAKRPRMGQVVNAFDNMANSDLTNGMRVGESEIFNSAQQSAEIRLFQRMAFGSQNYSTDFFSQSSGESLKEYGK